MFIRVHLCFHNLSKPARAPAPTHLSSPPRNCSVCRTNAPAILPTRRRARDRPVDPFPIHAQHRRGHRRPQHRHRRVRRHRPAPAAGTPSGARARSPPPAAPGRAAARTRHFCPGGRRLAAARPRGGPGRVARLAGRPGRYVGACAYRRGRQRQAKARARTLPAGRSAGQYGRVAGGVRPALQSAAHRRDPGDPRLRLGSAHTASAGLRGAPCPRALA